MATDTTSESLFQPGALRKLLRGTLFLGGPLLGVLVIVMIARAGTSSTAAVQQIHPTAIGSIVRVHGGLWVDPSGLLAWERAYADRDPAGQTAAIVNFETLSIPEPTPARLLDRRGDFVQVSLLAGPDIGRSAWTRASNLIP